MINHSDLEYKNYMYKKGFILLEFILIIVAIFVFVIITFYGKIIFNDVNTDFQEDNTLSNESKVIMQTNYERYPNLFDGLIITFFGFSWLLLLVALWNADSHPIFLIIAIVLLVFMIIICMLLGNAYEDITLDDELVGVTTSFPMTHWIMSNMLIVSMIIGFSGIIAYFGKKWVG